MDGITIITQENLPDIIRERPYMYLGNLWQTAYCEMISDLLSSVIYPDAVEITEVAMIIDSKNTVTIEIKNCLKGNEIQKLVCGNDISGMDGAMEFLIPIALSSYSELNIIYDNKIAKLIHKGGKKVEHSISEMPKETNSPAIIMFFTLDEAVAKQPIDFSYLEKSIEVFALLNSNTKILLQDKRDEYLQQRFFYYPKGIEDYFNRLMLNTRENYFQFVLNEYIKGRHYQVCVLYSNLSYSHQTSVVKSFADGRATEEGGSLVNGIIKGLHKACKGFALTIQEEDRPQFTPKDMYTDLTLVCSVRGGEVAYEGSTRRKLYVPEIEKTMKARIYEIALTHLADNKVNAGKLVEKLGWENLMRKVNREYKNEQE